MDAPEKTFSELISIIRSWNPWKPEPDEVSKVFWMPDQSCTVCYQCDSPFNLINRRHHCRLCGRIFCAKCTTNSVPAPSSCQRNTWEEQEKVRVCNYCYEQWEQGTVASEKEIQVSNQDNSASLSTSSSTSINSFGTANNSTATFCSIPYSTDPYQQTQQSSDLILHQSSMTGEGIDKECLSALRRCNDHEADLGNASHKQYGFSMLRTDDEEEEYSVYKSDSEMGHYPHLNGYYNQVELNGISNMDGSQNLHSEGDNCNNSTHQSFDAQALEEYPAIGKHEDEHDIGDENEAPSSFYVSEDVGVEPVDFENNGLLWLPPEPETEEDDQEASLFYDDDDGDGDGDANAAGEWGYLRSSSSFGSGESRHRDRLSEEHKKALKNVVGGHFRALIAQLLQVENLPVEDNHKNSWLEIVTSLSWEAASLLKPDTSQSGGMDPGGYVKVKCIASGSPCESVVIKGVVCKKNVAHRRMTSKVDRARLLILGGALEYQRVTNLLSSVDTLLQQEMDHLKMAVAKIAAHDPDVLLVEKSVSRYAQEYLLGKNISLVLNVKRPLLERIARCAGAQIAPSIDHLSSPKLGYCEKFHVEKILEDHGSASQDRKKTVKTLMFFEGCPKPLGCTILLRGADKDELKKVKHVVQYGFFAAYHLALETSFLADEGASLPELPLKSPITVALPDSPPCIDGSISTVPGFTISGHGKSQEPRPNTEHQKGGRVADLASLVCRTEPLFSSDHYQSEQIGSSISHPIASYSSATISGNTISDCYGKTLLSCKERNEVDYKISLVPETSVMSNCFSVMDNHTNENGCTILEKLENDVVSGTPQNGHREVCNSQLSDSELLSPEDVQNHSKGQGFMNEEPVPLKEEFSSFSDHQSILVSVSSRCVWKGTECEKSHLFRIKYYGNFDKPLGRFLRDHLFDQSYRCSSCEMPSEAHVQCYTHRQGTLTISVKKIPEILLPGEREGKIWMWHRCLRCPRVNGYPPATHRIIMSDAAWGLSFGKFLELSFSNHAAASRVASCGHSLHRDSLRFYGFGNMVACFRYASIDLHSIYLPPHQLVFDNGIQEWIQKETDEVINRAELLFSEVLNALSQIGEKRSSSVPVSSGLKTSEYRRQVAELEGMLQKEKAEFEEELQKFLNHEKGKDQPGIDILEIYRLRRQLLFQSFVWDHRLDHAAKLVNTSKQNGSSSPVSEDKKRNITENQINDALMPERSDNGNDSIFLGLKPNGNPDLGRAVDNNISQSDAFHEEFDAAKSSNYEREGQPYRSISDSINAQSDHSDLGLGVFRTLSDGQLLSMPNISDTLDAKWTGENHLPSGLTNDITSVTPDTTAADSLITSRKREASSLEDHADDQRESKSMYCASKSLDNVEDSLSWLAIPFLNLYPSFDKNFLGSAQKFDTLDEHPVYVSSSFWKLELQRGARLLLPIGVNDTVIPVYDDEPTSIISYALMSRDYHVLLIDDEKRPKDGGDSKASSYFSDLSNFQAFHPADDSTFQFLRSLALTDDMKTSMPGSRNASTLDPLLYTKSMHVKVSFGEDGPLGKVKHTVTCYYATWFEALRRVCCSSELDYIRSLSRCKKWGAQGGKSNVFFAKTLDDRFIIKQVTKTELESFIKIAPEYFKYLSESIHSGSPTCLAKILGIYQVKSKHPKGGKESRMDVLVMENLLFRRSVTRLYDLKGSARSRYNPDSSGSNKVLLDQNLIESMPTSPIFVSNKGKRVLERAVWNDTAFLASVDVMDYSLLLGVDDEKHELVLGIIDYMRQYTWDKHLETWVKASGILGGSKNSSPTVISPKQYKKRFRKAMTTYFLMLPDQWPPAPNNSQSDAYEENTQPKSSPK